MSLHIQDLVINVVSHMYERTMQGETYQGNDSMIKASGGGFLSLRCLV